MPLILVITDVDTPPVHCQRHIYVYHFVYLRPTQAAHEYSIGVAFRGPGGSLLSFGIVTVPAQAQSTLIYTPQLVQHPSKITAYLLKNFHQF